MKRNEWAMTFKGTETVLAKVEESGDAAVYVTRDRAGGQDYRPCGRMPVYHVWVGDEWAYCGQSLSAAHRVFEERANLPGIPTG